MQTPLHLDSRVLHVQAVQDEVVKALLEARAYAEARDDSQLLVAAVANLEAPDAIHQFKRETPTPEPCTLNPAPCTLNPEP